MRTLARNDAGTCEIQCIAQMLPDPFLLNDWMRRTWTIISDPPEAEYVMSPLWQIRMNWLAGDCDDAATLAASILYAQRIRCQLKAVRMGHEEEFSHVWCAVPEFGLDIDPIVPENRIPISYTEAMILEV